MKHANAVSLAKLEALLAQLRSLEGLTERKPGIFYRKSAAFLHFHEDPAGLFADVKIDGSEFARLPVNTQAERAALVRVVRSTLSVRHRNA